MPKVTIEKCGCSEGRFRAMYEGEGFFEDHGSTREKALKNLVIQVARAHEFKSEIIKECRQAFKNIVNESRVPLKLR